MTYPPLPVPTIIDGRRLYTAGDMRAYGDACVNACREADSEARALPFVSNHLLIDLCPLRRIKARHLPFMLLTDAITTHFSKTTHCVVSREG